MATIDIYPIAGSKLVCVLCIQSRHGLCVQRWDVKENKSWAPGPSCPGPGTYELLHADRLTPEAIQQWAIRWYPDECGTTQWAEKVGAILAFLDHARGM